MSDPRSGKLGMLNKDDDDIIVLLLIVTVYIDFSCHPFCFIVQVNGLSPNVLLGR